MLFVLYCGKINNCKSKPAFHIKINSDIYFGKGNLQNLKMEGEYYMSTITIIKNKQYYNAYSKW